MKIEKVQVFGFEASIRAMRNPKDSWNLSDSYVLQYYDELYNALDILNIERFVLGGADKKLAQTLSKAGSEHCKFLRSINVWFDITAPRYMWSEFDTYKFHVSNSCSTMHTIHKRELTQDDFEIPIDVHYLKKINNTITERQYIFREESAFINHIKNMLPEGFLQKRTINTNYAELLNQYKQRKNHRLECWREYCKWIETLPYFTELTGINEEK